MLAAATIMARSATWLPLSVHRIGPGRWPAAVAAGCGARQLVAAAMDGRGLGCGRQHCRRWGVPTARKLLEHGFEADVSPETLSRTTLGERPAAARPSILSRPCAWPIASAAISSVATSMAWGAWSRSAARATWDLQLGWHDPRLGRYICEKGSVAVNGISLTVASCHPDGAVSAWL